MNGEIFESLHRWACADAEIALGIARRKAAAAKAAKESGREPSDPSLLFVLLDKSPGEGSIGGTGEECTYTIFYTPEMIERVAKERPWMLAELLKELNGGGK